jgi:hypothetical protein
MFYREILEQIIKFSAVVFSVERKTLADVIKRIIVLIK